MPAASRIHNVADARILARRSLPRAVFDYIDGAAEDEVTATENEKAFRKVAFRPRMAVLVERPQLETTVLGTRISLPVILAPCGLVGLMHPDGALGAARAAKRAGTVSILSTVAGTPPEGLAAEPGPRWFQLYAAGRDIAEDLIGRAAATGFEGLVITVDTPALGKRERDLHHGIAGSFSLTTRSALRFGPQVLARPAWAMRMARRSLKTLGGAPLPGDAVPGGPQGRPPTQIVARNDSGDATHAAPGAGVGAGSAVGTGAGVGAGSAVSAGAGVADAETGGVHLPEIVHVPEGAPTGAVSSAGAVAMLASPFTWDDIKWIRDRWSGPLLVKGILSSDDAVLAADSGADAVVVSNHGGRQLEGAPATLRVLPEVVDAVGGRIEVLVDGGVRRGGDVVKALALGARAVLIGRPYLYSLAAAGEAGVDRMLKIFTVDMARTMALLGCSSVADLDRSWIQD